MKASLHSVVVIAAIVLCVVARQISGQLNAGKSSSDPNRIVDAETVPNGEVLIHLADGRQIRPSPQKGQIASEQIRIDDTGGSVGWLIAYAGAGGTSYPVPTDLVIYHAGGRIKHFGDGLMLLDWQFVDGDKHVQFSSSQVHGPGSLWHIMEVHDIQTGRLIKRWIEPANSYALEDAVLADLKGRVADAAGSALSGAAVAVRVPPSTEMVALTITERDGVFQIPNLQPGQYEVRVERSGFQQRTIPVAIGPNGEDLDLGTLILVKRTPASK